MKKYSYTQILRLSSTVFFLLSVHACAMEQQSNSNDKQQRQIRFPTVKRWPETEWARTNKLPCMNNIPPDNKPKENKSDLHKSINNTEKNEQNEVESNFNEFLQKSQQKIKKISKKEVEDTLKLVDAFIKLAELKQKQRDEKK